MNDATPAWSSRTLTMLIGLALVLAFLYLAKPVLIPLTLAILLTFLLTPAVSWLQHRGLPRVPAVGVVTVLALALTASVAWAITHQITSLVDTYPRYESNITAKIAGLRARGRQGLVDKVQAVVERLSAELEREDAPATTPAPLETEELKPQSVKIVQDDDVFRLSEVWSVAGPILAPVANTGLVLVLVIFMLIRREDLRDRVLALVGQHQLADTTRAFDDAGGRISRYLLIQLVINTAFGIAIGLGLWAIGVPYAPLWGFFATVLRYIPYLGPWLAALLPLAMSLLISRDWSTALLVLALFGALELTTNMFIEPWLYGRGIGVSQAALLVAVAFWTWFWGPVGLVLASPLTVCLVVLGKHVPFLQFLDTLLGDRPALSPPYRFYQRLLARDQDEAAELAEAQLSTTPLAGVFDDVMLPALALARADVRIDKLGADAQRFMVDASRVIAEELGRQARETAAAAPEPATAEPVTGEEPVTIETAPAVASLPLPKLLAVPARDGTDETGIAMLGELIAPLGWQWDAAAAHHMASDVLQLIATQSPDLLCIGSVPPGGLIQTRYLCKRVRQRFPD
ncbi:MAG TPA: AI-2E family transporter, partial [Xanthomonadaceae bacterium]|nr:AI-2E family transporter [Xanthomonadaceae bacterium]